MIPVSFVQVSVFDSVATVFFYLIIFLVLAVIAFAFIAPLVGIANLIVRVARFGWEGALLGAHVIDTIGSIRPLRPRYILPIEMRVVHVADENGPARLVIDYGGKPALGRKVLLRTRQQAHELAYLLAQAGALAASPMYGNDQVLGSVRHRVVPLYSQTIRVSVHRGVVFPVMFEVNEVGLFFIRWQKLQLTALDAGLVSQWLYASLSQSIVPSPV